MSGGLDSACVAAFYQAADWQVHGVNVDFGQAAKREEAAAAQRVASFLGVSLQTVTISGVSASSNGALMGRNSMLLMAGLMASPPNVAAVALGIHAFAGYWDCQPEFVSLMQSVFDGYALGVVKVGAPFLTWTKLEIARYSQSLAGLPKTYSCDRSGGPCGRCKSCRDIASAFGKVADTDPSDGSSA
jgi:7-cyano-7-deazaguanine synthase in queuosine biosynthesis